MLSKHIYSFLIIFTFFYPQENWIDEMELTIAEVDSNAILIHEVETCDGDETTIVKEFRYGDITKLSVVHRLGNERDLNILYYVKNHFVFAEMTNGKELYISYRLIGDIPVADLVTSRVYYKNENEGVMKIKNKEIYKNSNMDTIKLALAKEEFSITQLDAAFYRHIEQMYCFFKCD